MAAQQEGGILYSNGLPFSSGLDRNLNEIWDRVTLKKAALIVIDGASGEGKTTLAISVADYFNKINGLPPVDLYGNQVSMGGADFLDKSEKVAEDKLPCIIYDEAGDINKRGSLTRFNQLMLRHFETFRSLKHVVINVLPNFLVLDNLLFDLELPRMLLHLKDRTASYGNYAAYSLFKMNVIRFRAQKFHNKIYAFKSVSPNFRGHFLDISAERSLALDQISTKSKKQIRERAAMQMSGLLNYTDIAAKVYHSVVWVRKVVSELDIRHTKEIGRQKYFDAVAVNQIIQYAQDRRDNDRTFKDYDGDKALEEIPLKPSGKKKIIFKKKKR